MGRRDRKPKFKPLKAEEKVDLETAEMLFRSAKVGAAKAMRMCSSAIRALSPIFCEPGKGPAPGTFAVDKYYRLYASTDAIMNWVEMARAVSPQNPCESCGATEHIDVAYVGGAICHEAWHPLRQHYDRAKEVHATDPMVWNIGADCEINDDLMEIFRMCKQPQLCLPHTHLHLPKKYDLEDGKLAEHYYHELMDRPNCPMCNKPKQGSGGQDDQSQGQSQQGQAGEDQSQGSGDQGSGSGQDQSEGEGSGDHQHGDGQDTCQCGTDHGSGVDGEAKPWDLGEPREDAPGLSEAEGRMVRKEVAREIERAAKNKGSCPGGWKSWAEKLAEPPKYDWRRELGKALRWSVGRAAGDVEKTYRRLGRRCIVTGYKAILASTYKPSPIVDIVQDTSASMDDHAISMSITESEGIVRATGAEVRFTCCDTRADKTQVLSGSVKGVEIYGRGGTDMRVGIKAALENKPMPNIIIVHTDGYTDWPEERLPMGVRLVVCLVGEHAAEVSDPPEWATVVKIIGDDVVTRHAA